jgi:hypothetical protein
MPHHKRPASPAQLAANRAYVANSTGPRSPEGKVPAAQNPRRQSFCAAGFDVARLRADLIALYQPVNSQEFFAIECIALAQEARLRVARLEAGLLTPCLDEAPDPDLTAGTQATRGKKPNNSLAGGFHCLAYQGDNCKLFLRYRALTERRYRNAIENLARLKALRHELPNEPVDASGMISRPPAPSASQVHGESAEREPRNTRARAVVSLD